MPYLISTSVPCHVSSKVDFRSGRLFSLRTIFMALLLLGVTFSHSAYSLDLITEYEVLHGGDQRAYWDSLLTCTPGQKFYPKELGSLYRACFANGGHPVFGTITWDFSYPWTISYTYPNGDQTLTLFMRYACTAGTLYPSNNCGWGAYEFKTTTVCAETLQPPVNGECSPCKKNQLVKGPVKELNDKCHNGCELSNLSPTVTGKWVETLQGVTTGAACSDDNSDVKPGKMLACGTVGSDKFDTKTQNPIDFSIGNKFFRDTDYRGTGSFPIVFGRTYNSLNLGWRFTYTQRIEKLAADKMAVRRPGGQSYEFTLNGISWTPDPDVVERLDWQAQANGGAGGWRYTLANHTREFYDANGRLIAIRNSDGLLQTR